MTSTWCAWTAGPRLMFETTFATISQLPEYVKLLEQAHVIALELDRSWQTGASLLGMRVLRLLLGTEIPYYSTRTRSHTYGPSPLINRQWQRAVDENLQSIFTAIFANRAWPVDH